MLPDKILCKCEKADYQRMGEKFDIDWTTYLETDQDYIEEVWKNFILKFNEMLRRNSSPKK